MGILRVAAWLLIGGLLACGVGIGIIFGLLMAASHMGIGF